MSDLHEWKVSRDEQDFGRSLKENGGGGDHDRFQERLERGEDELVDSVGELRAQRSD